MQYILYILAYLKQESVASESTYSFCEREVIGKSYEGEDMTVLKVCKLLDIN